MLGNIQNNLLTIMNMDLGGFVLPGWFIRTWLEFLQNNDNITCKLGKLIFGHVLWFGLDLSGDWTWLGFWGSII